MSPGERGAAADNLPRPVRRNRGRDDQADRGQPAGERPFHADDGELRMAIDGLAMRYPHDSAARGLSAGQRLVIAALVALILAFAAVAPFQTLRVLAGVATTFFGLVVALRVAACINLAAMAPIRWLRRPPPPATTVELPVYTVLVPMFRESHVLPGLVEALSRLEWPAAKLDIKLIFESIDGETLAAATALRLPACFEVVVVPDAQPRTKPKALNYALQRARGDFVVIYGI